MNKQNYKPREYSMSEMKEAVRHRRSTKIDAKDVKLIGIKSSELNDEITLALELCDDMEEKHREWVDNKIKQIIPYFTENKSKYSGLTESEIIQQIIDSFKEGLIQAIRQDNKIYGNISKIDIGLENIISGYFFDFYRTLRVCQNIGVNPSVALEISQKSYYHNPDILIKLNKKYGEKVAPSLIQQSVIKSPQNSEAEIEKSVQKLEELKNNPRYSDIPSSIIDVAVFFHKNNPEAFLEYFKQKVDELSRAFPNLSQTVIKKIVSTNTRNPEDIIIRFNNKVLELRNNPKYSELNDSHIEGAALRVPNNPEGFLDRFIKLISELKLNPKYSELNYSDLETAAFAYPSDPEGFLDNYIKKVAELKANPKYSAIKEFILRKIALTKPKNPEFYLDNFLIKVQDLHANTKYNNISSEFIQRTAVEKPKNPEFYLDRFIDKINEIKTNPKYSGLKKYIIEYIAFNYPSDPEATLDRFLNKVAEIKSNPKYSAVALSLIEATVLKNINNPEKALDKILKDRLS